MAKIADIKKMKDLVTAFFCVANSAHVQHLNTRSFAQHEAFGNFYEFTNGFKDRLIEYLMGMGYVNLISLNMIDANEDTITEASDAHELLVELYETTDDSTLENMAADFQEALGKLKYMLMLK